MTNTQKGLLYARILLTQASQNLQHAEVVGANVAGFVALARSITFFMQKEFKHTPGFTEWYGPKQSAMEKDPTFKYFNDQRNIALKVKPPVPHSLRIETKFEGGAAAFSSGGTYNIPIFRVARTGIQLDNENPITKDGEPTPIGRTTRQFYFFEDRPDEDILELCNEHLRNLLALVHECHQVLGLEEE